LFSGARREFLPRVRPRASHKALSSHIATVSFWTRHHFQHVVDLVTGHKGNSGHAADRAVHRASGWRDVAAETPGHAAVAIQDVAVSRGGSADDGCVGLAVLPDRTDAEGCCGDCGWLDGISVRRPGNAISAICEF